MTETVGSGHTDHHKADLPTLLPLVGRATELTRLETLLEGADGGPSVVFVRGEGGVGKTRLVAELADRAERRSWTVVKGRAYPVGTGVPYAMFADAWVPQLDSMQPSALTVLTRGGDAELRYLFPALGDPAETLERSPSGEPDEFRTRLMWNFAEFLKRYAGRNSVLCVLEDLQWADESSLEILHFVARQVAGTPVRFVCTYNDRERDTCRALVNTERSLEAIGSAEVLHLQPLTREQVGELVSRNFVVDSDVVRDFAEILHGWTRGNAFFIEAILRTMISSGRLRQESGAWIGWDAREFGMPDSVRDAIVTRVADLDDDARTVLEMAAVVGRRVSFGVLESLTHHDRNTVLSAVDSLCGTGLLQERSVGQDIVYDFRHPLVRQTLYDELGLQRARIAHGAVAEAMESYYGADAHDHADQLAYHYSRAESHDLRSKAVQYLASAGVRALERRADQEAIGYLEAALERTTSDDAVGPLIPALARAHTHVGGFDSAARLWERALDHLEDDDPQRASILRALGMTNVWRGRHSVAAGHFDAGLVVAHSSGDRPAAVRLLVAKAHGLHEIGDGVGALSVLDTALPLAEEIGDPGLLARVHRALALLYVWLGPPERATEHGDRAIALADEIGDLSIGFWARWGMAVLAGMRGDISGMMSTLEDISAMADEIRSPVLRLWTAEMMVEHCYATGAWDAGIARGEQAIALARSLNQRTLLPRLLVWTSQFHVARGELERAESLVREAVEMSGIETDGGVIDVHQVVPTYIGLAQYQLHLGEYEEAIEAAEKGLDIAEGTGYTLWAMHRLLPVLAESCLWSGQLDRAEDVSVRIREHAERIDHRIGRAWADACDALIQWKRGDPEGSVDQMLSAANELEAIPMLWPATRLRRQVAGRLAEMGRRDDALTELRKVHAVCASVRAGLELEKTRAMFRELGTRPPSVSTEDGPLGLTEAELRVATLVAEGMSNKALASELRCATGTVRTHLQNIYQKLDVGGAGARHRLGNLIREAGLLD